MSYIPIFIVVPRLILSSVSAPGFLLKNKKPTLSHELHDQASILERPPYAADVRETGAHREADCAPVPNRRATRKQDD